MSYAELLLDPHWRAKRKEILVRDKYECLKCENQNLIKDAFIGTGRIVKFTNDRKSVIYRYSGQGISGYTERNFVINYDDVDLSDHFSKTVYIDKESLNDRFGLAKWIATRSSVDADCVSPFLTDFFGTDPNQSILGK